MNGLEKNPGQHNLHKVLNRASTNVSTTCQRKDYRTDPFDLHFLKMKFPAVTRENLSQGVELALTECLSQLEAATKSGNSRLERDLNSALYALRLIDSELKQVSARSKQQRSAAFTRYVVDEEPNMVMDEEFKRFIVKIEDIYRRYDVK